MSSLDDLTARLRQFVAERDWQQFHDPKNLAMLIASEAGELLAEYRWVPSAEADAHSHAPASRERIAAEMADIGIALLLLSDRIGVDLVDAMTTKVTKNAEKYPVET